MKIPQGVFMDPRFWAGFRRLYRGCKFSTSVQGGKLRSNHENRVDRNGPKWKHHRERLVELACMEVDTSASGSVGEGAMTEEYTIAQGR